MTNLKRIRLARHLTQAELASLSGVKLKTLQAYEQNEKSIDGAKLATLISLAEVLQCPISDMLNSQKLQTRCKFIRL